MRTSNLNIPGIQVPSSFRDPSGFLFWQDHTLYRQVNHQYKNQYDQLIGSGLYGSLTQSKWLIPHEEVSEEPYCRLESYKILKPELIPFISYPYEWSFSQLRDAALLTLNIEKSSLEFGMTLKDASAYNIQFYKGRPIFIDTLSFEIYEEGKAWVAYRQFCQHFLAPLALMEHTDIRLNQLLRVYLDGIPLDLASKLLPLSTYFHFSVLSHIHLQGKSQSRFATASVNKKGLPVSRQNLLAILDSLESAIRRLEGRGLQSFWSSYYHENNYSEEAMDEKVSLVSSMLDNIAPSGAWDFGANTGRFSRLMAEKGINTIAIEGDPICSEMNYRTCREKGEDKVLPTIMDLGNPSPNIGWAHEERNSLVKRGPVDVALALALIHHLAIANNLPLAKIAEFFKTVCQHLIIEFVPKSDSQVQRLLANRQDVFPNYTQEEFQKQFEVHFTIKVIKKIGNSSRSLYWMQNRQA